MKFIPLLLLTSMTLTSCVPIIVGGVASATVVASKDEKTSDTLKDVKLSAIIKANFMHKNFQELYAKIKISVDSGRVLMAGTVNSENDVLEAVKLVWDVDGVVEVINELKINEKNSHFDLVRYSRDSIITGQIKTKAFLDRDIKSANYTVITIDGIVYLLGIGKSKEEVQRIANISAEVSGVKEVISYVKVANN